MFEHPRDYCLTHFQIYLFSCTCSASIPNDQFSSQNLLLLSLLCFFWSARIDLYKIKLTIIAFIDLSPVSNSFSDYFRRFSSFSKRTNLSPERFLLKVAFCFWARQPITIFTLFSQLRCFLFLCYAQFFFFPEEHSYTTNISCSMIFCLSNDFTTIYITKTCVRHITIYLLTY